MWVLAFEAALVLVLMGFIVWWTIPRNKDPKTGKKDDIVKKTENE
jgi:hypothetical protein